MLKAFYSKSVNSKSNDKNKLYYLINTDDISVFARFGNIVCIKTLYNKELEIMFYIDEDDSSTEEVYNQICEALNSNDKFFKNGLVYYNKDHILQIDFLQESDNEYHDYLWNIIVDSKFSPYMFNYETYALFVRSEIVDGKDIDYYDLENDYPEYNLKENCSLVPEIINKAFFNKGE